MKKQIEDKNSAQQYSFSKSKIPRNLSYPLKRSLLDAALGNSSIDQVAFVFYGMRHSGNIVMRADFLGEGHGRSMFSVGKNSITLYAVPSIEKHRIETALIMEGLPRVCAWLQRVQQAGNAWRAKNHSIVLEFAAGTLKISDD
ncbi:MAG TPA: hypothetical protein VGQ12_16785 [Candidatus Angelobacter sp.]|nr:hypothetical protein [Candidatus Angelobacter sp.]